MKLFAQGLKLDFDLVAREVVLLERPPPLHRLSTVLKKKQRPQKKVTQKGNHVLRELSHSGG